VLLTAIKHFNCYAHLADSSLINKKSILSFVILLIPLIAFTLIAFSVFAFILLFAFIAF
jgi:hypothetical protein